MRRCLDRPDLELRWKRDKAMDLAQEDAQLGGSNHIDDERFEIIVGIVQTPARTCSSGG